MIIKPNWENWLNSYEDYDEKTLKKLVDEVSSVERVIGHVENHIEEDDRSGLRKLEEAVEKANDLFSEYNDHCEASKKVFAELEAECIGLNVLSHTALNLLDACAMEQTEEQTFTEIIHWCRDQCRANWDAIYYDRKEGSKEKRYLIVMMTNEDDRLFFKMRFG